MNQGQNDADIHFDPIDWQIQEGIVLFDPLAQDTLSHIEGTLLPGHGRYWLLAPVWRGISFLGLWDKYVPVPSGVILAAQQTASGWAFRLALAKQPQRVAFHGEGALKVVSQGARVQIVENIGRLEVWEIHSFRDEIDLKVDYA